MSKPQNEQRNRSKTRKLRTNPRKRSGSAKNRQVRLNEGLSRSATPRRGSAPMIRVTNEENTLADSFKLPQDVMARDAYLWGFMDPLHPSQGPGDANFATHVQIHSSSTRMTITRNSGTYNGLTGINTALALDASIPSAATPRLNGASTPALADPTVHPIAADGDTITFVACPHYVRTTAGRPSGKTMAEASITPPVGYGVLDTMRSGFAISGPAAYAATMYANVGGTVATPITTNNVLMTPFNGYDTEPHQVLVPFKGSQNSTTYSVLGGAMVRHRTVGLKISVEIDSPALTLQGRAVGGCNNVAYASQMEQETIVNATSTTATNGSGTEAIIEMLSEDNTPMTEDIFLGQTLTNAKRDLGPLEHQQYYEAIFLPTSDRVLQWNTNAGRYTALNVLKDSITTSFNDCTASPTDRVSTCFIKNIGTLFSNVPMAYVTMSGIPPGGALSGALMVCVKTSWAVEYVVENQGPLAMIRNEARLNHRFMIDWGMLSKCCTAGRKHECCTRNLTCCKPLFRGFLQASDAMPKVKMSAINPTNYQIGVPSGTEYIASKSGIKPVVGDSANTVPAVSTAKDIANKVQAVTKTISKYADKAVGLPGVGTIAGTVSLVSKTVGSAVGWLADFFS